MEDFQKRVVDEHDELAQKVARLTSFVNSDKFIKVDSMEQSRLMEQLGVMTQYMGILEERIGAFGGRR